MRKFIWAAAVVSMMGVGVACESRVQTQPEGTGGAGETVDPYEDRQMQQDPALQQEQEPRMQDPQFEEPATGGSGQMEDPAMQDPAMHDPAMQQDTQMQQQPQVPNDGAGTGGAGVEGGMQGTPEAGDSQMGGQEMQQ